MLSIDSDCGIRPATSTEAEFLQDYIRKSNNNAAQQSVNAARLASEQAEAGKGSDDDDDDEASDGSPSANTSKRNSLNLANGAKQSAVVFADEKTPTATSLLSQAQASQRPPSSSFPSQAPIRRHPGPNDGPLAVPSQSPPEGAVSLPMMASPPHVISVRHLPHFPNIEEALGANSTSPQGIAAREVWSWFQDHLDALLESIRTYRFDQFEMHVRTFWSSLTGAHREVVHAPAVAGLMAKADAIVYDVSALVFMFHTCQLTVPCLAGNLRVLALANAFADFGRHAWRSQAARRQDGEDTTCGA